MIESVIKLFADDTSMYLCLENPHIRAEILNNDLEKIMQWANKWKIEFNERKTELMNITRNKKTKTNKKTPVSITEFWKDYFRKHS